VLELAATLNDPDLQLQAHHAAWTTQFFQRRYQACLKHAERGVALYDINRHSGHALRFGGHDPGQCALSTFARALSLRVSEKAVAWCQEVSRFSTGSNIPKTLLGNFSLPPCYINTAGSRVVATILTNSPSRATHGISPHEGSAAICGVALTYRVVG
jgi:hypothetical protein